MSEQNERLTRAVEISGNILRALDVSLVGQATLRRRIMTALVCQGHILLEGVPGLGKTLAIKSFADLLSASFKRIQFTPDLLPADIIGTEVFRPKEGDFVTRKGPVFANLVLADEINRAPAKVQSALLETMQEQTVTIGENTLKVPQPFFVMATQNPIEQEGTYPLPEAQVDRFLMKVALDYPNADEERQMLDLVTSKDYSSREVKCEASAEDLSFLQEAANEVYFDDKLRGYVVDLIRATREPENFKLDIGPLIEIGASPRGTISLFLCARAEAMLSKATYVTPQHVKEVAVDVLQHRIVPSFEAEAEGLTSADLVRQVLDGVEVP